MATSPCSRWSGWGGAVEVVKTATECTYRGRCFLACQNQPIFSADDSATLVEPFKHGVEMIAAFSPRVDIGIEPPDISGRVARLSLLPLRCERLESQAAGERFQGGFLLRVVHRDPAGAGQRCATELRARRHSEHPSRIKSDDGEVNEGPSVFDRVGNRRSFRKRHGRPAGGDARQRQSGVRYMLGRQHHNAQ